MKSDGADGFSMIEKITLFYYFHKEQKIKYTAKVDLNLRLVIAEDTYKNGMAINPAFI